MKHSRRHSTGNLMLELTGYEDVLSRYLSPPVPSCHDNCKPHSPGFDNRTPPKSTRKRSNKTDSDSVHGLKKPFTHIPRSPTEHVKVTATSLLKHPPRSPPPIGSKRHDIKSKSKSEETDPFYIPPSRITRRYSDVNLPTFVSPAGSGLVRTGKKYDKKIDSKKDVKPVKPVKRTVKTPAEDGANPKKVLTLETLNSSTKPGVDQGSKKSTPTDPVGEVIKEKSQSQSEERVLQDETSGKKTENPTRVRKLAKEKEDLSSKTLKFKQGKSIGPQSESNSTGKVKFGKGKVLDENKKGQEDGKSLRRMSSDGVSHTPESNSVNVSLKHCNVEASKPNTRLNNVIEETVSKLRQTRKSKVASFSWCF